MVNSNKPERHVLGVYSTFEQVLYLGNYNEIRNRAIASYLNLKRLLVISEHHFSVVVMNENTANRR